MDKAFEHIGIYDFWYVFGAGIVVLTSEILFLFMPFRYEMMGILCNLKEIDLTVVIIYITVCYTIGLLIHYISSMIARLPFIGLNIKVAANSAIADKIKRKRFKFLYNLRKRYVSPFFTHNDTKKECEVQKFDKRHNYLKANNLTTRADKYHAIYGMSRSMALGYSILVPINLLLIIFNGKCNIVFFLVGCVLFAILAWLMFLRTKEYYYRWIGWVFTEYEYAIKKERSNT